MKLESLTDLKKLIQLCRKEGVFDIKVDGVELHISPTAPKRSRKPIAAFIPPTADERMSIPTPNVPDLIETPDELTEEQLMFYSSGATNQ